VHSRNRKAIPDTSSNGAQGVVATCMPLLPPSFDDSEEPEHATTICTVVVGVAPEDSTSGEKRPGQQFSYVKEYQHNNDVSCRDPPGTKQCCALMKAVSSSFLAPICTEPSQQSQHVNLGHLTPGIAVKTVTAGPALLPKLWIQPQLTTVPRRGSGGQVTSSPWSVLPVVHACIC